MAAMTSPILQDLDNLRFLMCGTYVDPAPPKRLTATLFELDSCWTALIAAALGAEGVYIVRAYDPRTRLGWTRKHFREPRASSDRHVD